MPPIMAETPAAPEVEPKPLATPIRWLLVIPAAIGGALAMAVIAALIVLFSGLDDFSTIGAFILVLITLSAPMASINVGAGQAPGHKEQVALILAALWGISLTLALIYVSAMGVSGVGSWALLVACCVAGVTGVVWGYYYARTEGEAAT